MNAIPIKLKGFIFPHKKFIVDCLIAILIGIICSFFCLFALIHRNFSASDFQFPLQAAKAIEHGQNPYQAVIPMGNYPFDQYFYYPIMAAFFAFPFTILPDQMAGAGFIGVTAGFLAYALSKNGRWRLGIFLSAPAFVTIYTAQWSFLIAFCLLIPELQFLLLCKPNIGIAAFLYKPTKKGILSILVGFIISLILFPNWIADWTGTLAYIARVHAPPAFSIFVIVFIFCLTQIARPEGRLVSTMLIAPQAMFFYDQLLLWFVPKNPIELWILNLSSWIGYISWRIQLKGLPDTGQYVPTAYLYVLWLIYLPTIIILLIPQIKRLAIIIQQKLLLRQ